VLFGHAPEAGLARAMRFASRIPKRFFPAYLDTAPDADHSYTLVTHNGARAGSAFIENLNDFGCVSSRLIRA